jgi:phage recombination protein Bet
MTTEFALQPTGIDPDVSASLAIYERIKPLKDALGIGNLTDGEMQVFALVARYTGLDPFTKQIYAIKRGGKVTHQTGIDGYRSTAERTGQYAGSDEAEFEPCECGSDDSPPVHPKLARVVVHRILPSGHVVNQLGKARWHELKPKHTKGDYGYQDDMWWKMPENQLAKCAEADGLRKAFPRVLGGVYITDEMQGADTIEGEAREVTDKPAPVTVADRIAARRAEREGTTETTDATSETASPTDAADGASVSEPAAAPPAPTSPAPTEAAAERPDEADAAGEESMSGASPAPNGLCGAASVYNDAETCNLASGHKLPHRVLDARGIARTSW